MYGVYQALMYGNFKQQTERNQRINPKKSFCRLSLLTVSCFFQKLETSPTVIAKQQQQLQRQHRQQKKHIFFANIGAKKHRSLFLPSVCGKKF